MSVVTFTHPQLGRVRDELIRLGAEVGLLFYEHCQRVLIGSEDYKSFMVFATYRGIEMFRPTIDNDFIVYAVEKRPDASLKISVMFAGRHGTPVSVHKLSWDGYDYAALINGIILARARAWFTRGLVH
jgi:hypothetical protein